jgi:hypothetical protein
VCGTYLAPSPLLRFPHRSMEVNVFCRLPLRVALFLAAVPVLVQLGSAQNIIVGGPGNSTVNGTDGHDDISDPSGSDIDVIDDDGLAGNDGKSDHISSVDGDNNDSMSGGPEDTFLGDDGDWVRIEGRWGSVMWQGPYSEYRKIRRMIQWLRSALNPSLRAYPHDMPTLFDQWFDSLAGIRQQLDDLLVVDADVEEDDLEMVFPIEDGDEVTCDKCWSPDGFWTWLPPSPYEEDVSYVVPAEEFTDLVSDLQEILDYVEAVIEEEQEQY